MCPSLCRDKNGAVNRQKETQCNCSPALLQNAGYLLLIVKSRPFMFKMFKTGLVIHISISITKNSSSDVPYIGFWYHLPSLLSQDLRMVWKSLSQSTTLQLLCNRPMLDVTLVGELGSRIEMNVLERSYIEEITENNTGVIELLSGSIFQ
ncbi:uncharacterized protein AAES06_008881 isoform 2-T5 [Glossophaga mutica]